MRKFVKIEVIMTDDSGYLALKALLPKDGIVWARTVGKEVIIRLKHDIDLDHIEKSFNSLHRTLSM